MRESSGRTTSSKRPDSSCSSSVDQRVEAAALLVDEHDVAGADPLRGLAARRRVGLRLARDVQQSLLRHRRRNARPRPGRRPTRRGAARRSPRGRCGRGSAWRARTASAASSASRNGAGAATRTWSSPNSAAACAKSSPVRRGDVLLERGALRRDGQEVEDPAAVVVEQHDRRAGARAGARRAARRGRAASATSPISSTTGPPRRRRRRTPSRRCRRSRSRRGWTARAAAPARSGKNVSTSRTGIERGDDERRLRRQPHAELGGHARLAQALVVAEHARDRGARRARSGAGPLARARTRPAGAPRDALGERVEQRRAGRRAARGRRPGRVLPRASRGRARSGASSRPASHCAQRLGGRQVADAQHELGRARRAEGRVAQQRVVVRDRRRAAARARQRVGEQRQRRRASAKRRERGAEPRVALARARRRAARAGAARAPRPACRRRPRAGGAARPGRVTHGRPSGAPAAARLVGRQRLVEHERLAQREVQVHRARAAVERGPARAAGERAQPAQPLGRRRVVVDLDEPLGRARRRA